MEDCDTETHSGAELLDPDDEHLGVRSRRELWRRAHHKRLGELHLRLAVEDEEAELEGLDVPRVELELLHLEH